MDTTDLINSNSALVGLLRQFNGKKQAIENDLTLPSENKDKLIEKERQKFLDELSALRRAADSRAKAHYAQLNGVAARSYMPAGDPVAGIAADEQTWRRIKSLLDAGVDAGEILEDAVKQNDKRSIKVLSEEHRAYSWGQSKTQEYADAMTPLFDKAKYDTGSGAYKAAVDAKKQVDRVKYAIDYNAQAVENALNGRPPAALLSHDHTVIDFEEN